MNLDLSTTRTTTPDPVSNTRRPFLTPLPEPGHFLMVLDNTSLDKIKRCHRAAANYLILGREAHAKNAALSFGGALHAGLEVFHKNQWAEEHVDFMDMMPGDWSLLSEVGQDQAVLRYFTENPTPPDEYRTPTTALEVLKHYRKRSNHLLHPDYEWEILADESGPLIERSFELPIAVIPVDAWIYQPDMPEEVRKQNAIVFVEQMPPLDLKHIWVSHIHLAWSGRIDLLVNVNQRNRVADHKTTSILGDQFIQSFQIASQTIGYVWAAQQLWPNLHPTGFCLNAIALKKPTKGGGSLIERGPKGGEPALSFFRSYFDYSDERIQEWRDDTIAFVEDFIHSLVRNQFPLNDKQCFDKFGQCAYHSVCTIDDPRVRERLLASDAYKQVTWNPTAH